MDEFSYENIDLFYYHSIDIDFFRLFSILESGILSKRAAMDEKIKDFYRNYSHASCRDDYISVSHFPQTVLRYYKIENELYDFNARKIAFILSGKLEALEKQHYKKRYQYTNERHVLYKISTDDILGILIRDCDAKKKIIDTVFFPNSKDKVFLEYKIFANIHFFLEHFNAFQDTEKLYYWIGKLREEELYGTSSEATIGFLKEEMRTNINRAFQNTLEIENPTLLDAVKYINNNRYPIYTMNRYDIALAGAELSKTDDRLEKLKRAGYTRKEVREKEEIDREINHLLSKMSEDGCRRYVNDICGPFEKEDMEIIQKVKQFKK